MAIEDATISSCSRIVGRLGASLFRGLPHIGGRRCVEAVPLLVAIGLRLFWLSTTSDYAGDAWRRIINMTTLLYHPIWPPGYFYLAKPFYVLFGHPDLVLRLTSAVLGVAAIPLTHRILYAITRNSSAAFIGSMLLALHPGHTSYSVQSMSEVPFFTFVLLFIWCYMRGRLGLSALMLAVASMMRFEAWPLLVLVPLGHLVFGERAGAVTATGGTPPGRVRSRRAEALQFFAVSVALPTLYLLLNWWTTGYFFYHLSPVTHIRKGNPVLEPRILIGSFARAALTLPLQALANEPNPVNTTLGTMGHFVDALPYDVRAAIAVLVAIGISPLALAGAYEGFRRFKSGFWVLPLAMVLLAAVPTISTALGYTYGYVRYFSLSQFGTPLLASVGASALWRAQRNAWIITTALTAIAFGGFIALNISTRYTGPETPILVARSVREVVTSSNASSRLQRVLGLTGPPEQTARIAELLGLDSWIARRIDQIAGGTQVEVLVIDGGFDPPDVYRMSLVQAVADLSYHQFRQIRPEDAISGIAEFRPEVVVLANDSLGLYGCDTRQLRLELSSVGYDQELAEGDLEVWRRHHGP